MSGHSKWSTIKHKKAATDAKRGAVFTRIIKEITVAARIAGGDPDSNPRLRLAIAQARDVNMPNNNVERAIKKGTGDLPGVHYESSTYEGYSPGGSAFLIEVNTDNKKRTVADIRHIITKHGGNLGESGSVAWQFEMRGTLIVPSDQVTEDDLFEIAMEYNAQDIEEVDGHFSVAVPPAAAYNLRTALIAADIAVTSVDVGLEPTNSVDISGDDARKTLQMLEALEENEDVEKVSSNFNIPDDEMDALSG